MSFQSEAWENFMAARAEWNARLGYNEQRGYYLNKLMEEVGEVAEAANALIYGSKTKVAKIAKSGQTPKERMEEEIADAINVLLMLAETNDIAVGSMLETASQKLILKMEDRLAAQARSS